MAAQTMATPPRGVVRARNLVEDREARAFSGAADYANGEASEQNAISSRAPAPPAAEHGWRLEALAGRFIEIADTPATAALSATAALIAQAQRRGEFAAWIGSLSSLFFPPDFAAAGIDLASLPVVSAADAIAAAQSADVLLRSDSFALLVLDLRAAAEISLASQTRLVGLAQKHRTTLLCLTRADRRAPAHAPRGSFVSLRIEAEKIRAGHDAFTLSLRAVKDKHRAPGWTHREACRGTDGLC